MSVVAAIPTEVIRARHDELLGRLRAISAENGHDPNRLRIVGVTKGQPVELARAAVAAGLTALGENRVQDAEPKVAAVPEAEWHFIGRLQSNKVRRVVRAFTAIHSVDSLELLRRVRATEDGAGTRLLLQVNVSGEATKAGMPPSAVLDRHVVEAARAARVVGLMTIAPLAATHAEARAIFRGLRDVRDRLEKAAGIAIPELSMGMSGDADAAAAEGATLVRIGTALFGPRI